MGLERPKLFELSEVLSYMTYLSYLRLAPSCLAPLLLGSGSLAHWRPGCLTGSLAPYLHGLAA